jgi:hypothetical protein
MLGRDIDTPVSSENKSCWQNGKGSAAAGSRMGMGEFGRNWKRMGKK